ncbi:hypothetical protein PMAYCL1PPCAC_04156, partial [Pristionchus mayeri]
HQQHQQQRKHLTRYDLINPRPQQQAQMQRHKQSQQPALQPLQQPPSVPQLPRQPQPPLQPAPLLPQPVATTPQHKRQILLQPDHTTGLHNWDPKQQSRPPHEATFPRAVKRPCDRSPTKQPVQPLSDIKMARRAGRVASNAARKDEQGCTAAAQACQGSSNSSSSRTCCVTSCSYQLSDISSDSIFPQWGITEPTSQLNSTIIANLGLQPTVLGAPELQSRELKIEKLPNEHYKMLMLSPQLSVTCAEISGCTTNNPIVVSSSSSSPISVDTACSLPSLVSPSSTLENNQVQSNLFSSSTAKASMAEDMLPKSTVQFMLEHTVKALTDFNKEWDGKFVEERKDRETERATRQMELDAVKDELKREKNNLEKEKALRKKLMTKELHQRYRMSVWRWMARRRSAKHRNWLVSKIRKAEQDTKDEVVF